MKVIFVGEGPAKDYLIDIMSRLDLDDSIDFVGHQQNPIKYMCKADLFVLPSRYEGSPLVLVEALLLSVANNRIRLSFGSSGNSI